MLRAVLATEFLKLRRCKVTWFTLAGLSMGPLGIALFMWILREPERAASLGLLGTKANLSGLEATWPAYADALTLIVGIGGMLLLSFIVAYVFGREYDDATAKNMLALPVGRHWFVVAKLVVAAAWWAVLTVAVLAEAFVVGFALGLPGFSAGLAVDMVSGRAARGRHLVPAGAAGRVGDDLGARLSGAHRLRDRDDGAGQPVREDRLVGVVPVVDRALDGRAWWETPSRRCRRELRCRRAHLRRRRRGRDRAAALRRLRAVDGYRAAICSAMSFAASPTPASRPDFHLGIHGSPTKYRPGYSVTPLRWTGKPSPSKTGRCTQLKSNE